jgi:8-oxo-dGTP pyrophosphatase MutT (NUDIX family)
MLQNVYTDGTTSEVYACDVVSRRDVDAVCVVLFDRDQEHGVRVLLRRGVRPPVYLRTPQDENAVLITEIVAGVIEEEDAREGGVAFRAAAECEEEAGIRVAPNSVLPLGGGMYPSPGVTDERVEFRAVEADLEARGGAAGDGSVMEEHTEIVLLPLREAIRRCRAGEIPDMKTEIGLLRLCDAIGYLPLLDRFVDELPKYMQKRVAARPPLI